MNESNLGTVYLIHFDRPYRHAQHYIGWAKDLEKRIAQHRSGNGSKLMAAVVKKGITFEVVRTWHNVDRHFERKLKNRRCAGQLCPLCALEIRARKAEEATQRRKEKEAA